MKISMRATMVFAVVGLAVGASAQVATGQRDVTVPVVDRVEISRMPDAEARQVVLAKATQIEAGYSLVSLGSDSRSGRRPFSEIGTGPAGSNPIYAEDGSRLIAYEVAGVGFVDASRKADLLQAKSPAAAAAVAVGAEAYGKRVAEANARLSAIQATMKANGRAVTCRILENFDIVCS